MDEKYTYNGQEYSRADLEAKYGDRVDEAISKFGFELVKPIAKTEAAVGDVYTYDGVDYTESQLKDKYGDRMNEAIEKFGIKKKRFNTTSSDTRDSNSGSTFTRSWRCFGKTYTISFSWSETS